jgi:hypothetical protein
MGIKEGELQAKDMHNTVNKITAEISQILRKRCQFRFRRPPGQQTDMTKIETFHNILLLKQLSQRQRKNIEGCKRKNNNL